MDVMQRRRELMGMRNGLDTSPIIDAYNAGMGPGNNPYVEVADRCVTVLYEYPAQSDTQTIVATGLGTGNFNVMRVYINGVYKDYWVTGTQDNYERKCVNANTNGLRVTLVTDRLLDCYVYLKETGQILFAGKNSIYYGHRNISELN